MSNNEICRGCFLVLLVGFTSFSKAASSQEQAKLLYVADLDAQVENDILSHLLDLNAHEITVLSDSNVYEGDDFGRYDLIIIADTSPGISDYALDVMKSSGVPIFAIVRLSYGSYATRLGMRTEAENAIEYAIYSTEQTYIRESVTVENGSVGSAGITDIGIGAEIYGDVESVGSIHIAGDTFIDGDVISAAQITQDDESTITITGDTVSNGDVTAETISSREVDFSGNTVEVYSGEHRFLDPGEYTALHAFDGATVTLSAGAYRFGSFILEAGTIALDVDSSGGIAQIDVQNEMRFGDRNMIGLTEIGFMAFYTNYSEQIKIGSDSIFYGSVTAPNGQIYVFPNSEVYGSLAGKEVWIDVNSLVSGFGYSDTASGETVYMYDTCHPVTFASDLFFDAYTDNTAVRHGTSFDNLFSGISVLVVDGNHNAVVLLDDAHKIIAGSLSETSVFTQNSWVIFDQILNYLKPMGHGWDSFESAWDSVVESGILDYIDDVASDPYLFDYEEAVAEAWRLLACEDLGFLRYWANSMLNWLIGQDADPSTAPFEIYDSATLRQYMEGDFSQPVECTCIEGCDEARTTAGTLNTEDSVCYEISGSINGWNAWDLGNRTIQVNGTTVSSGESLPAQIEGKYYFYFSAGTPSWNGWTYW